MSADQKSPVLTQSPSAYPQAVKGYDDEIDLLELWRRLMRGKWIIIGLTAAFSVFSVAYALSLPNMYKSTAVLAPADSSSGGGLAGQFSGLASLAGINLGKGVSSKTAEALEILRSWAFVEAFISQQNIAPEVIAVKGWNPDSDELIYNTEIFDPESRNWTGDPSAEPGSWELYERFSQYLSVTEDKATGFTSVSIEYFSPEIAKRWVDALVIKINTQLQARDAKEAEKNIGFLRQQIEATTLASMQSVFYDLIEEQTKTLMLAKGSTEYVFKTVSESRAPEQRSKPKRALICVIGAFLGGLFGIVISLIREFVR